MKVSYKRKYPIGQFLNEDIGFELEVDDYPGQPDKQLEIAMNTVEVLKNICDLSHKKLNPEFYKVEQVASNHYPQPSSEEQRINALIQDINACTAISEKNSLGVEVGLLGYEKLASGDAALKAAYDLRLFQLKPKPQSK